MKDYKVFLSINNADITAQLSSMIDEYFSISSDPNDCDVQITDNPLNINEKSRNVFIVHYSKIPEFREIKNIHGFEHYVIYEETSFLQERVERAITRQFLIKNECLDVNAIISTRKLGPLSIIKYPMVKNWKIKSSSDRKTMSDELQNFIHGLEPLIGLISPSLVTHALEMQEELLMNAIWDANPKYRSNPRNIPVELEESEIIHLQWIFNGEDLAISVKDTFGSFDTDIMEKYVNFIFRTKAQVHHKINPLKSGAGLGMYMIMQKANVISVYVSEGKITDVGAVIRLTKREGGVKNVHKAIDIITKKQPILFT